MYILALDQSTTSTGYSLWHNNELIKYGVFKPNKKESLSIKRIVEIKKWLKKAIGEVASTEEEFVVVFENIQFQLAVNGTKFTSNNPVNVFTFEILAKLLGVLEEYCLENNINYKIIEPSTWKSTIGIRSKYRSEQKKETIAYVKDVFGIEVKEDIADAICIGYSYIKKTQD